MLASVVQVLAFGWQPEVRGIVSVLLIFVALCGSVYLLLGTNLGWRLGFLVAFAGFFGWMFLMGAIWWVYGIGLQGAAGSWQPVEIVQDGDLDGASTERARSVAPVLDQLRDRAESLEEEAQAAEADGDADRARELRGDIKDERLEGWVRLPEDDPGRGQAQASADAILAEEGVFQSAGDYIAEGVYSYGGQTYPKWFFNFLHKPHYNLVAVQPVVAQRQEPGQAPPRPIADDAQAARYVLMIRDLGYRRRPAALITVGSGIVFGLSALALHRRDQLAMRNRGTAVVRA